MIPKLSPLPISSIPGGRPPEDQRWLTQAQQQVNIALQGTNGYYYNVPVSAATVVVPSNVSSVLLRPVAGLAALTVQLPATISDGTILRIVSSQAITALTVTGTGTVTISGAPAALVANVGIAFQYIAANSATGVATPIWQRLS